MPPKVEPGGSPDLGAVNIVISGAEVENDSPQEEQRLPSLPRIAKQAKDKVLHIRESDEDSQDELAGLIPHTDEFRSRKLSSGAGRRRVGKGRKGGKGGKGGGHKESHEKGDLDGVSDVTRSDIPEYRAGWLSRFCFFFMSPLLKAITPSLHFFTHFFNLS